MPEDRRVKVLFVTGWYPTKDNPVAGVFVREHAKAASLYDDVAVLHFAGPEAGITGLWRVAQENDETLTEGIRTYRAWHRYSPVWCVSHCLELYAWWMAFRRVVAHGFRPQIIHAHILRSGPYALLIGRACRVPVVVTEHTSAFPRGLLRTRALWKARFVFSRAAFAMPVSGFLKQAMEGYGIKGRFKIVPNVVDARLFRPKTHLPPLDLKRILSVSLLDHSHNKGLPILLGALARLKSRRQDWCLDIVGDGAARSEYETLAGHLGLADTVRFHGLKSKLEVAEFMRRSHLLVVTSHVETFCVAAAEALATGTPVVATRCGGPEDFVSPEVGLLIPPGDVGALLNAVDYMLDHLEGLPPDRISRYATERFGHEQVGEQLHAVYTACLHEQTT